MKYCIIKNNEIYKYNVDEPKVKFEDEEEIYLPIIDNKPIFDNDKQKIIGSNYIVNADNVTIEYLIVDIPVDDLKPNKIHEIKNTCTANNPITLEVDFIDGHIETITFNGGDSSASAIAGAVTLAQNLGETNVNLWDINNVVHNGIAFSEAMEISAIIAKKWRNDMFKRQDLLTQINNATTLDELGSIQWQD